VPHDAAEPVGFSVYYEDKQVSIATDLGHMTDPIFEEISSADLLVLESNHEENLLMLCGYPYEVKQRILSDEGHLSNVTAGQCICHMKAANDKPRCILLGHLSHESNSPSLAMQAVTGVLAEHNIVPGKDLFIDVARRGQRSDLFKV
jgi:phosphoribosyl 1,2-cyclic phosphodiesterase